MSAPHDERDAWVRREPGFLELRIELMRMYRRARRRPLLTILVALLCAGVVCAQRSRKKQSFAASVTFRVSEVQNGAQLVQPRPTKELKEYVQSVAMRSSRLIDLMKQLGLYKQLVDADPVTAVDFFRSDVGVEVYRNYFVEEWSTNKSARLVVTYFAGTAEEAATVVAALGELIVEEEQRRREATAEAAASGARELAQLSRVDVDTRQAEITKLENAIPGAPFVKAAAMKIELQGLRKSLGPATERFMSAQGKLADLELALVFEMHDLGVRFDKVDDRVEVVSRHATPTSLAMLGGLIFVLALPLAIMFVGAFDSRVYDLDDVNRLGLFGVGHVPAFKGDAVGSLEARARASGRV